MKEGSSRMRSQIIDKAHYKVINRATLNANLLLPYLVVKTGMICQVVALANSLGSQSNSMIQFFVVFCITLACVEVHVEFYSELACFLFGLVNLGKVVGDGILFLLAYHVKTYNHIGISTSFEVVIDLLLDMFFALILNSTNNNLHCEKWEHLSNLILYSFEHF